MFFDIFHLPLKRESAKSTCANVIHIDISFMITNMNAIAIINSTHQTMIVFFLIIH